MHCRADQAMVQPFLLWTFLKLMISVDGVTIVEVQMFKDSACQLQVGKMMFAQQGACNRASTGFAKIVCGQSSVSRQVFSSSDSDCSGTVAGSSTYSRTCAENTGDIKSSLDSLGASGITHYMLRCDVAMPGAIMMNLLSFTDESCSGTGKSSAAALSDTYCSFLPSSDDPSKSISFLTEKSTGTSIRGKYYNSSDCSGTPFKLLDFSSTSCTETYPRETPEYYRVSTGKKATASGSSAPHILQALASAVLAAMVAVPIL